MPQTITPREYGKLPPTEYISTFTMQQKTHVGSNFASGTERFKPDKPGSIFAVNTAEPSSFRLNNPYH